MTEPSARILSVPRTDQHGVAPHEHAWATESRHRTSEGLVRYVRCVRCGSRRVDLQGDGALPPAALSRSVGADPAAGVKPAQPAAGRA